MGQVNIALDAGTIAALDRVAAGRGVRRPELLRQAIAELIEAHDGGRLAFQSDQAPRIDTSLSALVHQLREVLIEHDRVQAENTRLFGKLIESWNGGEEATRTALDKVMARIRDLNHQSYQPFIAKVEAVLAETAALPTSLAGALEPHLARISEQLEANNALARSPRTQHNLVLGDDRMLSLWFLSAMGTLVFALGGLFALIGPGLLDGAAVGHASRLIDSPARLCRLIERQYGVADCKVPPAERQRGLQVIAQKAKP